MEAANASHIPCIPSEADEQPSDVERIVQLRKDGLTQTAIAQQLACSQSKVSRILSRFVDTRSLARERSHNSALEVAEALIEGVKLACSKGDAEAALEVLDRLNVLEKRQVESKGSGVVIAIGMPGQPAGPDPVVIDLSPETFAPNALNKGAGSD